MDDLAAELRFRKLEPPYSAVEQGLADRPAQTKQAERKRTVREVAREIATEEEVRDVEVTDGVPDDER